MSRRTASRLGWSLWALAVALMLVSLVLLIINGSNEHANSSGSPVLDGVFSALALAFPTVGALVVARQPANAVGWLFLGAGLGAPLEDAALGYAALALEGRASPLPGGALAALIADVVWIPTIALATTLLFLLFPDGRLSSRRWKPLVYIVVALASAYAVGTLLAPGPLYFYPRVDNPLGVDGPNAVLRLLVDLPAMLIIPTVVAAAVALGLRFRRSRGDERRQLKWLVYAAGLLAVSAPISIFAAEALGDVEVGGLSVSDVVFTVLLNGVAVAVGIAVLRHRLYDIDLVISRTLVYGGLTATLVVAYLGSVLLLQVALRPITSDSDLAIAGSTLAVAALFRPARRRIQSQVDRRFYRRRYDASRTLERFGARLRDEVDLDSLGSDLRGLVRETVEPAHVSLWLRGPEGSR